MCTINIAVPLPLRANSAMRDSLKTAMEKAKASALNGPAKVNVSNSADSGGLSEITFAMDNCLAFVFVLCLSTHVTLIKYCQIS